MSAEAFDRSVFAEPWLNFIDEFGESPALTGPTLQGVFDEWDTLLGKIVTKYTIPGPDDMVKTEQHDLHDFWVRSYIPPDSNGQEPCGVYYHGGGWAMGSVEQEDAICRLISRACKMRIVSAEYRLAPANKYPIPLEDCTAAALWTAQHFSQKEIILIGASAGGNLAFGTALKLIDQGKGSMIKGIAAMVPVTIHPGAVPEDLKAKYTAYDEHAMHTVNTRSAMEVFFDAYAAPPNDKYTSCLLHPQLGKLPRCYITESGTDTLRDDARLMKETLEKAGVQVKYDAYPGYPHYSWTFPSKVLAEHQADFFGRLINGVNWVNDSSVSRS